MFFNPPTNQPSFNTQPPEGGWRSNKSIVGITTRFNTQPPEGGWLLKIPHIYPPCYVSTHSRPKAAGRVGRTAKNLCFCFNTQPPEGGWRDLYVLRYLSLVSTHSRPKAAGTELPETELPETVSTHSRPKAAGRLCEPPERPGRGFNTQPPEGGWSPSSPPSVGLA